MRRPHLPKTTEGATRAAVVGAVLLTFGLTLFLIGLVINLSDDLDKANHRLINAGQPPVGEPGAAGEPGVPGVTGQQGRAPTTAEILGAVTAYCVDNTCRGPAGRSVTPAQVAAAVQSYCNDRGECRGPRGGNGNDGADGSNGRPGAQGPPPSDAQVAQAVAAFCADGRCRGAVGPVGPQGPTGSTGAAGSDGRGITSIDCESTPQLQFTVTYSDGAQETVSCTAIGNQG